MDTVSTAEEEEEEEVTPPETGRGCGSCCLEMELHADSTKAMSLARRSAHTKAPNPKTTKLWQLDPDCEAPPNCSRRDAAEDAVVGDIWDQTDMALPRDSRTVVGETAVEAAAADKNPHHNVVDSSQRDSCRDAAAIN